MNITLHSEKAYAALIHAYAMNKMQDQALEVLESMRNGSYGDDIRPGLTSFTASILAAMYNSEWKQVLRINELMTESGIEPSCTTFQGVLLANMREGNTEELIGVMESAIDSNMSMDQSTFQLCSKSLLPNHCGHGDVNVMRKEMRRLAKDNSAVAITAMDLNKTLRDCLHEDQRRPSNAKSEILIQRERARLWRGALEQAIQLSKIV